MNTFADDLIRSLDEALAHARGKGPAVVHEPPAPRDARKQDKLTRKKMAPSTGRPTLW